MLTDTKNVLTKNLVTERKNYDVLQKALDEVNIRNSQLDSAHAKIDRRLTLETNILKALNTALTTDITDLQQVLVMAQGDCTALKKKNAELKENLKNETNYYISINKSLVDKISDLQEERRILTQMVGK